MKTSFYYISVVLSLLLLFGCKDEIEEPTRNLVLSVPTVGEAEIKVDGLDFEFEILDGNGGYKATLLEFWGDNDAEVTIKGNKVTINFFTGSYFEVIITDKRDQEVTIGISSNHPSLDYTRSFTYIIKKGDKIEFDFDDFGAGAPYTVEKVKGNSAEISIKDGKIICESLGFGTTRFKVKDSRGASVRVSVNSNLNLEINKDDDRNINIDVFNNLLVHIGLKWGQDWKVVSSSKNITEYYSVGRYIIDAENEVYGDYYFIISTKEKEKGTDSFVLRNSDGEEVKISATIK